jgi:hypothetical protein
MTEQEITAQKEIEFYATATAAWFDTKLERDKSLLTLSAGGIGLLITLLSTIGIHSVEILILYAAALFSFICSLVAVLWIFKRNAVHLENINRGQEGSDLVLDLLDNAAIFCFFLAVVLSSIMGISSAFYSFQTQESLMANGDKSRHMANDSFSGIKNMLPAQPETLTKSFNNAASMKPAVPPPASTQTQTSQPAASKPAAQPTTTGNK